MNITEFASTRNEQSQTISIYIKRHPEQFEGHTRKVGKTVELDNVALEILDKVYPLPRPVQLVNGVDPEEHKAVLDKLASTQEYIIKLQNKMIEDQKLLAQAEAQKILLEDKNSQLEAARAEGEKKDHQLEDEKKKIDEQARQIEELKNENARLKNRSFFERVFNK